MKLSIVIVNYNVEYFLEHCLLSVFKALQGIEAEVFVIDNNSVDGSLKMLSERFPSVKVIANKENVGFAKANNQAIRQATGEYVLLLNPDTVVMEDTFKKCLDFMDSHPKAGGLGVKMIDGQGKVLKESKRGFPTPWVCLCKFSGLASLFPHSKRFCGYYMGHLSYNKTSKVDILAGAYMLLRRECLDKCGLLDEDYFMYGEDIDLSYRITLAGYENYYFADTKIIHYKGESTKKGSLNYVYTFYNAMDIFAKKHMPSSSLSSVLKVAIWFKALFSFAKRILGHIAFPLLDFILLYVTFFYIKSFWAATYWQAVEYYPIHYSLVALPVYALIIEFCVYVFGGYDKHFKLYKLLYGVFFGMIALLVFYSLLPSSMRYSRAMVIMCSIASFFVLFASGYVRHLINNGKNKGSSDNAGKFVLVGDRQETARVSDLLVSTGIRADFIGMVSARDDKEQDWDKSYFIGDLCSLDDVIRIYNIGQIIFCAKSMSQSTIVNIMSRLSKSNILFTIAPEEGNFIIGSNTINTSADAYVVSISSIYSESNRRKKRLFDFFLSLALLIFTPVLIFFYKRKLRALSNLLLVVFSSKTMVGYSKSDESYKELPPLKNSVLCVGDNIDNINPDKQTLHRLNLIYARNYSVKTDADILFKNIRNL